MAFIDVKLRGAEIGETRTNFNKKKKNPLKAFKRSLGREAEMVRKLNGSDQVSCENLFLVLLGVFILACEL